MRDIVKKITQNKQLQKGTKTLRPIFLHPVTRRALIVTAAIIFVYTLLVTAGGIFIYRKNQENGLTRFTEAIFPYPVAVVNDTTISLARFRLEVRAREHYVQAHQQTASKSETEKFVESRLVNTVLYREALRQNAILVQESDVETKLQEIYADVGGEDKLSKYLRENYGENITLEQFRIWIRDSLIEAAVQRQLLTHSKIRHILIAIPENATPEQVAERKKKAEEIRNRITSPDQFAAIAKEFSEDIGSRDQGGEMGSTVKGSDTPVFSKEFEDTAFTIPIGEISQPVQSPYGWHIITVDERTGRINMSLKEYTEQLRNDAQIRLFLQI